MGEEKIQRPSYDEFFMMMAKLISAMSTCKSRSVGAVLVRDKQIIATGFNGAPKGLPHCDETGCVRIQEDIESGKMHEICRGAHAEINIVSQCSTYGVSSKGATLYCTTYPCPMCAKTLINADIDKIYYAEGYGGDLSAKLLDESDIEVKYMEMPDVIEWLDNGLINQEGED